MHVVCFKKNTCNRSVLFLYFHNGHDADQAATIKAALDKYLEYRESVWMDEYLPDEKPKLDNAVVWRQGNYVMYAILGDSDRAAVKQAFESCFEG